MLVFMYKVLKSQFCNLEDKAKVMLLLDVIYRFLIKGFPSLLI